LEYCNYAKKNLIEPWAIELMCNELLAQLREKNAVELEKQFNWLNQKTGLEKLMALDALRQNL
jgi:hypothetical protein